MSIFSQIFGGNSTPPAQPAPGNANSQPGNTPGTQQNGVTPPTGLDPNGVQTQQTQQTGDNKNVSPLDSFADLWKTDPNAANNQQQTSIFGNVDPQKMMEAARKVDFSKAVTPEQLDQISKGGPEAVAAFAQAMNSVAQNVYAQNAMATTKIVEQALGKAQEQYDAKIPTLMRKLSANDNLLQSNPLLANPAIQPLVGALTEQLTRKNPNATQQEIQQQVQDYFAALGTSFAPKQAEPKNSVSGRTVNETDWDKFLTS